LLETTREAGPRSLAVRVFHHRQGDSKQENQVAPEIPGFPPQLPQGIAVCDGEFIAIAAQPFVRVLRLPKQDTHELKRGTSKAANLTIMSRKVGLGFAVHNLQVAAKQTGL
jgi:hypothetical protein